MSLADQLSTLASQVRALEAENASLRRENKRLRLGQTKSKPSQEATPWAVLGVTADADAPTITAAFRKLAQQHHPDRAGGDRDLFQQLVSARDQLLANRTS